MWSGRTSAVMGKTQEPKKKKPEKEEATPRPKKKVKKEEPAQCGRCGETFDVQIHSQSTASLNQSADSAQETKTAKRPGSKASKKGIVPIQNVNACGRCWLGYVKGGWEILGVGFSSWAFKCGADKDFNEKAELQVKVAGGEMPCNWSPEGVRTLERFTISSISDFSFIPEVDFCQIVDSPLTAKDCKLDIEKHPDAHGNKKFGIVAKAIEEVPPGGPSASLGDGAEPEPGKHDSNTKPKALHIQVRFEQIFERKKIALKPGEATRQTQADEISNHVLKQFKQSLPVALRGNVQVPRVQDLKHGADALWRSRNESGSQPPTQDQKTSESEEEEKEGRSEQGGEENSEDDEDKESEEVENEFLVDE